MCRAFRHRLVDLSLVLQGITESVLVHEHVEAVALVVTALSPTQSPPPPPPPHRFHSYGDHLADRSLLLSSSEGMNDIELVAVDLGLVEVT